MLKCKLRCSWKKTKNCLLSDKHLCLCLLTISSKSRTLSKYEQKNSANNAKCAQMLTLLSHWPEYQTNCQVWKLLTVSEHTAVTIHWLAQTTLTTDWWILPTHYHAMACAVIPVMLCPVFMFKTDRFFCASVTCSSISIINQQDNLLAAPLMSGR